MALASFTPLNPAHPSQPFSTLRTSVNSITTELAISQRPKQNVRQWALRKPADQEDKAVGSTAVAKEINVNAATAYTSSYLYFKQTNWIKKCTKNLSWLKKKNGWINSLDWFHQIWHYVADAALASLKLVKQIDLCQNVTSQNVSPARFLPSLSKSCAELLSRQDTRD